MRVIAGSFRSRILQAPAGPATRPTSDRLRETLFNVLAPRIDGVVFADLYAGTGAVGIEALSRGAAEVVFVERAAPALKVLRGNLDGLGLNAGFRIVSGSVAAFLRKPEGGVPFDLVFLDADKPNNPHYLTWALRLSRPGTVIVADNVVRNGEVANPGNTDPSVQGIRRFNELLASEPRVQALKHSLS